MNLDEVRARLAALTAELEREGDADRRDALRREQDALREHAREVFTQLPEGRAMLEEELAALERRLAELESQKIKKAKTSLGGGSPSGGGLEPADVHYLRSIHERWNDVPALRARIEELHKRLE
jgi:chromosome segregation ATPase